MNVPWASAGLKHKIYYALVKKKLATRVNSLNYTTHCSANYPANSPPREFYLW